MPDDRARLAAALAACATRAGFPLSDQGGGLAGSRDEIVARWILGDRRVRHSVRCELDEASLVARWHEYFVERTRGLAPPTFTVERTTISGRRLSGERRDVSLGGGGTVDYGALRAEAERCVRSAGWRFDVMLTP